MHIITSELGTARIEELRRMAASSPPQRSMRRLIGKGLVMVGSRLLPGETRLQVRGLVSESG